MCPRHPNYFTAPTASAGASSEPQKRRFAAFFPAHTGAREQPAGAAEGTGGAWGSRGTPASPLGTGRRGLKRKAAGGAAGDGAAAAKGRFSLARTRAGPPMSSSVAPQSAFSPRQRALSQLSQHTAALSPLRLSQKTALSVLTLPVLAPSAEALSREELAEEVKHYAGVIYRKKRAHYCTQAGRLHSRMTAHTAQRISPAHSCGVSAAQPASRLALSGSDSQSLCCLWANWISFASGSESLKPFMVTIWDGKSKRRAAQLPACVRVAERKKAHVCHCCPTTGGEQPPWGNHVR